MATQTQTFPCPSCERRMGIGVELLGRQVLCPHCKQVILVPASPGMLQPAGRHSGPTPALHPSPLESPAADPDAFDTIHPLATPPVIGHPPLRSVIDMESSLDFNFPVRKELADSILSDQSEDEDEVISSQKGSKTPVPIIPDVMSASCLPATEPLPGPVALDVLSSEMPTIEVPKPAGVTTPHVPPPRPLVPTPAPVVILPAHIPAHANPFVFDPTTAPSLKSPPEPPTHTHPPTGHVSHYRALVTIIATYAVLMTALAVYGLFFKPDEKGGTAPIPARGTVKP